GPASGTVIVGFVQHHTGVVVGVERTAHHGVAVGLHAVDPSHLPNGDGGLALLIYAPNLSFAHRFRHGSFCCLARSKPVSLASCLQEIFMDSVSAPSRALAPPMGGLGGLGSSDGHSVFRVLL